MSNNLSRKDIIDIYEQGKHRRYGLLFSVNGGAFAIGKLLIGGDGNEGIFLGGLSLAALSVAMMLFSFVMGCDIWQFGKRMIKEDEPDSELFGPPGKIVLVLLVLFVMAAWGLVGFMPAQAGA